MGLLNRALSTVKKEEKLGGGLLARAERYAGSAQSAESSAAAKTPPAAEEEEGGGSEAPSPAGAERSRGKGERRGLLKRALFLSGKKPARPGKKEEKEQAPEPPAIRETEAAGPVEEEIFIESTEDRAAPPEETAAIPLGEELSPVMDTVSMGDRAFMDDRVVSANLPSMENLSSAADLAPDEDLLPAEGAETKINLADEKGGGTATAGGQAAAGKPGDAPRSMSIDEVGDFLGSLDEEETPALEEAPKPEKGPAGKVGRRSGLLAKAEMFAEENAPAESIFSEKAPPAGKKRPAQKSLKEGKPAAPAPVLKAPKGQKPEAPAPVKKTLKGEKPGAAEREEKRLQLDKRGKEMGKAEAYETQAAPVRKAVQIDEKDFVGLIEYSLGMRDAFGVLEQFNGVIAREGHTSFLLRLLEAMARSGKGKTAHLFTRSKERYAFELSAPEAGKAGVVSKVTFKHDARFIEALRDAGSELLRYSPGKGGTKGERLKKDASGLGPLAPWTAVTFPVGGELVAFAVIGRQSKSSKIDGEGLVLLGRLAAPYVHKYLLLKEHRQELSLLDSGAKEKDAVLSLYAFFDRAEEMLPDQFLDELLQRTASVLSIDSAVVCVDWRTKGVYLPAASVGVPKKALAGYRLAGKDNEIQGIIESGRAGVPGDSDKRILRLSKEKEKWLQGFVVVPLRFNGETAGLLAVHGMKGAGKKLDGLSVERLSQAGRVLVPGLLFGRLAALSPYKVMDDLVTRELEKAKRGKYGLSIAVFTLEKAREAYKALGFGKYRTVVERLHKNIERRAGAGGIVREIDWHRVALLLRDDLGADAEDVIAGVRVDFAKGLKKAERELGMELTPVLTEYPKESKTPEEILCTLF